MNNRKILDNCTANDIDILFFILDMCFISYMELLRTNDNYG